MMSAEPEQKITINVDDPIVLNLLPVYVERRRMEIGELQELLESSDYEKIRLIGHNLKGSGGLYGLPQISEFGSTLETAALSSDDAKLGETFGIMQAFIERIEL